MTSRGDSKYLDRHDKCEYIVAIVRPLEMNKIFYNPNFTVFPKVISSLHSR